MRRKGISLIVLVITIVVIIVLAAAVILSLGNNNPIENAKHAAREQEKADLIDDINLCVTQKLLEDNTSIEKYLNKIPNATIEKVNSDAYYVIRGSTTFTVDNNGKYETSRVNIWDGTSVTEPTNKTENEIHITSCAELKWLANQVNNEGQMYEGYTIYLDSDLDFGARAQNNNWETDENEALEWTPIGPSSSQLLKATFNGNNHFIKGIYVNREDNFNGIFGTSYTIENLTMKDSYIKGGAGTAGIVGFLVNGKVENCHNVNTTVILREGNYHTVGGVVGQNNGSVLSCSNSGNIIAYGISSSGNSQTGGVVGNASTSSQITNCYNTGSVTGKGLRTGGVVGVASTSSQVTNCYNTGSVTGKGQFTGGVVGLASTSSQVTNCYNTGSVTGKGQSTGGVVGNANPSTQITNCYNTGTVVGEDINTGGVVGITFGMVDNCYNTGSVTGKGQRTGGVAGIASMSSQVTNCYNTGAVIGEDINTGGVVGITFGIVDNCYNTGSVTGKGQRTGGVVGAANPSTQITNCYNTGTVVGEDINTGGVVGITFGMVDNCYNTGTVKGNVEKTGGIVGQVSCLDTDNTVKGTLKNSYNIGKVEERGQKIGGVTGSNGGTVENCYFLDTSYSVGVGYTDEDTVKNEFAEKTESEMKDISFVELLGSSNWEIQGGKNNGYPVLK